MSDIKFLLLLLRYKTFNLSFLWKVISFRNIHFFFFFFFAIFLKTGLFCKVKCYFLYVICSFIAWSKLFFATQTLGFLVQLCIYPDRLKFILRKSWSLQSLYAVL